VIVVDSNVVASLFLPGEYTARAEALLELEPDWVALVLWRSEFRNILAGYLRRGTLKFGQATLLLAGAEALLAGREFEVDSVAVLERVRDSHCSAYDCEFVVRARKLGVRWVTMDAKWIRAFPDDAVSLVDVG